MSRYGNDLSYGGGGGAYSPADLKNAVKKATNSEIVVPKRKHLMTLLDASRSGSYSVGQICDLLLHRISSKDSWVNTLKCLLVYHYLLRDGSREVNNYLGRTRLRFRLENYMDRGSSMGYEMSMFIRKYSIYLEEKINTFVNLDHDFVRARHGENGTFLHQKAQEGTILPVLECLQVQIDALLDVDVHHRDLTNPCILNAFSLLLKDMIKLFVALNDSVINILEKYFDMPLSEAKTSFELYKKFCDETGRIMRFLEVARTVSFNERTEIPDLKHAPTSLITPLNEYLLNLEGKPVPSSTQNSAGRPSSDFKDTQVYTDVTQKINSARSPENNWGITPNSPAEQRASERQASGNRGVERNLTGASSGSDDPFSPRNRSNRAAGPSSSGRLLEKAPDNTPDLLVLDDDNMNQYVDKLPMDVFDPMSDVSAKVQFRKDQQTMSVGGGYNTQQPMGYGQQQQQPMGYGQQQQPMMQQYQQPAMQQQQQQQPMGGNANFAALRQYQQTQNMISQPNAYSSPSSNPFSSPHNSMGVQSPNSPFGAYPQQNQMMSPTAFGNQQRQALNNSQNSFGGGVSPQQQQMNWNQQPVQPQQQSSAYNSQQAQLQRQSTNPFL
eukprot:Nk52_evm72s239 gene=Nk52_evmTU72s239